MQLYTMPGRATNLKRDVLENWILQICPGNDQEYKYIVDKAMKRGTSLTENQRKTQISWQRQSHSALFCEHSEMLWHWIILNRERVNGGEKKDYLITFPLTQHSQHLSLYEIHIHFNIKITKKHFCITLNVTC